MGRRAVRSDTIPYAFTHGQSKPAGRSIDVGKRDRFRVSDNNQRVSLVAAVAAASLLDELVAILF